MRRGRVFWIKRRAALFLCKFSCKNAKAGLANAGKGGIVEEGSGHCPQPFPLVLKNESRARMTHSLSRQKILPTGHCPLTTALFFL